MALQASVANRQYWFFCLAPIRTHVPGWECVFLSILIKTDY